MTVTALATSMAVNTLVTGLIVFKIHKVFLEVGTRPTSVERLGASGLLSSTVDTKLRHITFIIIESAMALFALQLVRIVFATLASLQPVPATPPPNFVVGIYEMFNVIIRSVRFYFFCFSTDNILFGN